MGLQIHKDNKEFINFGIDKFPNRKQKALYIIENNEIRVLAYFPSDEQANEFQSVINKLYSFLTEYLPPHP